jgi:hypothetical protein
MSICGRSYFLVQLAGLASYTRHYQVFLSVILIAIRPLNRVPNSVENLPRTQASLCKKTVMRIGRVYMKYCSGDRWAKGLMGRVHLNCDSARRLAVLGRFLARKSISCKLWYFVVVYHFLLLVFVELTNVNILLSSGREFMMLFLVYMTYALLGSNTQKLFFLCFNAMMFIFGQFLGHGTTNIKISFSKLPLSWLPC